MNLQEIINFLSNIYSKPLSDGRKRYIVFWYDENEDTENNILVYCNMKKPSPKEDWLHDILLYSNEFSTDRTTVIMRELKINDDSLKGTVKDYSTFFKTKERLTLFKNLNIEDYTKEKIHLGVLSVLTKTKILEFEEIVKALIKDYLDDKHKLYDDIDKFGSLNALWDIIIKYYGYTFEEQRLERLMAVLLITNMNEYVKFELPKKYNVFLSPKVTNCIVFINHFMNHSKDNIYYDKMEALISNKLKIKSLLEENSTEKFSHCDIFEDIDKIIIKRITDLLNEDIEEYDKYLAIISNRRTLHFYNKYKDEYKALKWAINLLKKKRALSSNIKDERAYDMIKSYINKYNYIDKSYRKFYLHYDRCIEKDILENLREKIENVYNNWYLQELSIKWFRALNDNKESWRIDGVKYQDNFFSDFIDHKHKERVYVVISDALRYDCGEELSVLLTNDRKGKVELDFMEGVLPSYTELGMASLLPHDKIEINEKYNVLIDRINSNGIENRNTILKNKVEKSIALQFDKVMDMKEGELRKAVQGRDVVYIYHNAIDAIGDHAATEREVFEASETAFKEIINLVNKLVNRVTAPNIIITADHGYLYKRDAMEEYDKISGVKLDDGEDTRRFILTTQNKEVGWNYKI